VCVNYAYQFEGRQQCPHGVTPVFSAESASRESEKRQPMQINHPTECCQDLVEKKLGNRDI
jgi:hypothetical protein